MAEHLAIIEPDGRPQRPDAPVKINVRFEGDLIVRRVHDPERAACRALLDPGITGYVTFQYASGVAGLTRDIETGARLNVRGEKKETPALSRCGRFIQKGLHDERTGRT